MNRYSFLVAVGASAAALAVPLSVLAETQVSRLATGGTILAAIKAFGTPEVTTLDSGHTWIWRTPTEELRAITDDDGIVRVVDDRPLDATAMLSVDLDGRTFRGPLMSLSSARADAEFSSLADVSTAHVRSYALTRTRRLVLIFDDANATLTRAVIGERGSIARLALLPADEDTVKAFPYRAPRASGAKSGANGAIIRSVVDRAGRVTDASIVLSTGDDARDKRALVTARSVRYSPATYSARPVGSVAFAMFGA